MADMRISLKLDASTSGAEALKALITDLTKIELAAKRSAQEIKSSASATNSMNSRGLFATAARFVEIHMAADLIRTAVTAIPKALAAVVTEGIRVSAEFESIKFGIASVINAQLDLANSSGRQLEGAEKYNAALELSEAWFKRIRIAAVMTQATTEQLSRNFQTGVSVAAGQGITDLEKVFKLTVAITNAATAMNVNMAQVPVAIRAVLTGREATHNVVARTLGITLAQINAWKAEGTLVENLEKRLTPFSEAAEKSARSFKVLSSNMLEAFQILSSDMMSGAFKEIQGAMNKYFWDLFDFKNMSLQSRFQPLVDAFNGAFTEVGVFIASTIDQIMTALDRITLWIKENPQTMDELRSAWASLLKEISGVIGQIGESTGAFAKASAGSGALAVLLKALALAFAGLSDGIRITFDVLAVYFTAILHFLTSIVDAVTLGLIPAVGKFRQKMWEMLKDNFFDIFGKTSYQKALDSMDQLDGKFKDMRGTIDSVTDAKDRMDEKIAGTGARNKGNRDENNFDARDFLNKQKQMPIVTGAAWGPMAKPTASNSTAMTGAKEQFAALLKLARDYNAQQVKINDDLFKGMEISVNEYYDTRKKLAQDLLSVELELLTQEKAAIEAEAKSTKDFAKAKNELAKIDAEMALLKQKQAGADEKLERDRLVALEKYRDEIFKIKEQIANTTGSKLDLIAVDDLVYVRLKQSIEKIMQEDVPDIGLLDRLLQAEKAKMNMERFVRDYRNNLETMNLGISAVDQDKSTGKIGPTTATSRKLEIYRTMIPVLEEIYKKEQQIAEANPDSPELVTQAEKTKLELDSLNNSMSLMSDRWSELKRTGADALANGIVTFLNDISDGTQDVADSFRQLALSVVSSLHQMLTKMLAVKMMESMMKVFGGGNSYGQAIGAAAGALAGNAEGGLITGPGTGTSDSIIRRLSNGEYVIRAAAVRSLGLPFLDALNGMKSRPTYAFAGGGPVGPVAGIGGDFTHTMNIGLDRGLILEVLESPEATKINARQMGKNPRRFNQALGSRR
jgi:hypothetical protein